MDKDDIKSIIGDLEYSAFNLCKLSDSEVEQGIIESTCPEVTLILSIRRLKAIIQGATHE